MAWRMAKSLEVLRKQINDKWPKRDTRSDGGVGDLNHASRKSDHNPNADGVVCARDFDADIAAGFDGSDLADRLVASKDPRIKYIISEGRICSGLGADHPAWVWRKYTGVNAHFHHCHVSVRSPAKFYDDTTPWKI